MNNVLTRHYTVDSSINLKFSYIDGTNKSITLRVGDEVTVFANIRKAINNPTKINGIIYDIINKKVDGSSSFRSNEQSGNGGYDLLLRIDVSPSDHPDIIDLYLIDIYDIILGDDEEEYIDPYPPIPGPTPQGTGEPVDPSISYTITASTNRGIVDYKTKSVFKNDDVSLVFSYDDVYSRFYSITINDEIYIHDKKTGIYTPELPTNIGITEVLPKYIGMRRLFTTVDGKQLDIDMYVDDVMVDTDTKIAITGLVTVDILSVDKDYDIKIELLTDEEIESKLLI